MEIVNAISKVRFASTGPQHIHLARADSFRVDLLCMEAGQKSLPAAGPCAYYVVAGSAMLTTGGSAHSTPSAGSGQAGSGQAKLTAAGSAHSTPSAGSGQAGSGQAKLTAGKLHQLPAGQLARLGPGEAHTIANAGQGRLICLVIRAAE